MNTSEKLRYLENRLIKEGCPKEQAFLNASQILQEANKDGIKDITTIEFIK